jgi:hypothetical protein
MICAECKKKVTEVCPDGYCEECHVSCSWEDCTTGAFSAQQMLSNGHTLEETKKLYPNAKI